MEAQVLERLLPDEAATTRLGEDLALALRRGDVLALSGNVGAGKTTLARALVRANAADPDMDVPSPTFTLVQAYDGRIPIAHFDLYRLGATSEFDELGLDDALSEGAALIEWPERAGSRLPPYAVRIDLAHDDPRLATISGAGAAFDRVKRTLAIRDFLDRADLGKASRAPFPGDASARAYELIARQGRPDLVLMNSPRLVLGPPVRDGKPYAVIAHTAQTVAAFVAMDHALSANGVSVPRILAADLDQGLVLMEHLGSIAFLDHQRQPIAERYAAAAELLAMIHVKRWPPRITAGAIDYEIPPFDRDAMMIEIDLLLDWYVPWKTKRPVGTEMRAEFAKIWNGLFDRLETAERSIVLRDYHSPNIVWRGDRVGHERLGILDFQDAMIGPSAYDLASLAMDARATIAPWIERATIDAYSAARREAGDFDEPGFRETYAIMAAQRNTKILGIFVRLDQRDAKPAYLAHLPRIRDYLRRAVLHPALAPLAAFFRRYALLDETSRAGPPGTAMVLAAGLGKRMRPITDTLPKPLVPISGRTLLDRSLDGLAAAGVKKAVVNVHYLPDQIVAHLADRHDMEIVISDESGGLLDSAGAIVKALPELGGQPFYILNADTFWIDRAGSNIERLTLEWDPERMDILLMLSDLDSATGHSGGTDFLAGADGRLSRAGDNPDGLIYAGAGIVDPRLFADAPAAPHSLNRYFDAAIAVGRLYGMAIDGSWITVGTPDAIPSAERAVERALAEKA